MRPDRKPKKVPIDEALLSKARVVAMAMTDATTGADARTLVLATSLLLPSLICAGYPAAVRSEIFEGLVEAMRTNLRSGGETLAKRNH